MRGDISSSHTKVEETIHLPSPPSSFLTNSQLFEKLRSEEMVGLSLIERSLLDRHSINGDDSYPPLHRVPLETTHRVVSFTMFSLAMSALQPIIDLLRASLIAKHSSRLTKEEFPALADAESMAVSILDEFFAEVSSIGMKNLHAFILAKTPRKLIEKAAVLHAMNTASTASPLFDDFLASLKESCNNLLIRSNNTALKKPCDHKKRSVMTLFRTPITTRKKLFPSSSAAAASTCEEFRKLEEFNNAVFAESQPIRTTRKLLDVMYVFLGDANEHKILKDPAFVEKHIEVSDRTCRE